MADDKKADELKKDAAKKTETHETHPSKKLEDKSAETLKNADAGKLTEQPKSKEADIADRKKDADKLPEKTAEKKDEAGTETKKAKTKETPPPGEVLIKVYDTRNKINREITQAQINLYPGRYKLL